MGASVYLIVVSGMIGSLFIKLEKCGLTIKDGNGTVSSEQDSERRRRKMASGKVREKGRSQRLTKNYGKPGKRRWTED